MNSPIVTITPPYTPGLVRQAASFATAVVRHVAAGLPTRTLEQQAAILVICKACKPYYDPASNRCKACKCALSLKIPMALEKCPLGKW